MTDAIFRAKTRIVGSLVSDGGAPGFHALPCGHTMATCWFCRSVATLSPIESKRFLAPLGQPFAPNVALRRAMKRGDKLGV
ncbi:MAG: hypothetical protein JSS24_05480 [Proteobacteria bacterium]|nr:hypothetical protein [Pseudomonadota bacterium]